jgi:hypothetical protein
METKQCPYCLEHRELKFFRAGNRKCKKCHQKDKVERYHTNPEIKTKVQERVRREYHERSPEQKERIKEKRKIWENANREKINTHSREAYQRNKSQISKCRLSRIKKRMLEDEVFEARVKLTSCLTHFLRKNRKNSIVRPFVGCSPEEYREHIEKQWAEGMAWENYGSKKGCWNIDHIIPLSSAQTVEELKKLFHFSNTQPLWTEDNIKKSNKL